MVGGISKNKRGWITILEATIAVMLVSGVLVTVYSRQVVDRDSLEDFIVSMQKQVLADISGRADLRLLVLEEKKLELEVYVDSKIPSAYRYSLKLCNLDSPTDHCKLNRSEVIETRDKDTYADEVIIAADLGDGINYIYAPKKVRLIIWSSR